MFNELPVNDLFTLPEGRTLEYKESLPANSDLAKTVVAFANDAGGEIYIGVNDSRDLVGLSEDELPRIEEAVSNLIFDRCYPAVLPDISFLTIDGKNVVRVKIYRGSTPPYYLKSEGKIKGTYIRVGSNNRLADSEIIMELERRRRNVSFDGEVVMDKRADELDIREFCAMFQKQTGQTVDEHVLRKLELVREDRDVLYPTNALVLLSDDPLKSLLFPNAKIECARFKGTTSDVFIDSKSVSCGIAQQVEDAYAFVLRHINYAGSVQGVYTVKRWEYPVTAVREIIRNAVVHRQYSLGGKDIKVAVYDDMIEITSPGLLPPSIDYSAMQRRQSDARNRVIAPVFKALGLIDQWGNGLRTVYEELKAYPEIGFRWKEVGLSFQVQFYKKDKETLQEERIARLGTSRFVSPFGPYDDLDDDKPMLLNEPETPYSNSLHRREDGLILNEIAINPLVTVAELAELTGLSKRTCERQIASMKAMGVISRSGSARGGRWVITVRP